MKKITFPPSPYRALDRGPLRGTEVWRVRDGVTFHHWDRWLLRLACEEPGGLPALREQFLRGDSRYALGSIEEMQAQVRDLQQRLDTLGVAPHDLLDEQERSSSWLLKKAQKRVLQDGPYAYTEAMWRTPRRVLEERIYRGFWPEFPISPGRFEPELRQPSPLPSLVVLDLEVQQLLSAVSSDAERMAIHRAAMTLLLEAMKCAHDEGREIGITYREHEEAYLLLARLYFHVPAVLRDLICLVAWEDYGMTLHTPGVFESLPREQALAALELIEKDLAELRREGLSSQAKKAERLRDAVLRSYPDLVPLGDDTTPRLSDLTAVNGTTLSPAPSSSGPALAQAAYRSTSPRARPSAAGSQPRTGSRLRLPPGRQPVPEAEKFPDNILGTVATSVSAGDFQRALFWGERWLARYPWSTKGELHRKLAEAYEAQGRLDDAVEVLWRGFVVAPGVEMFRALRHRTNRLGEWPWWRQQALDHLRVEPSSPREAASKVVEILLFEGKAQEAYWEARQRPCKPHLWAILAGTLAEEHPLAAIEIYRDHVSGKLRARDNKQGFEVAAAPLRKLAQRTKDTEVEPIFHALISWLRDEHAHFKHILDFFDEQGWR